MKKFWGYIHTDGYLKVKPFFQGPRDEVEYYVDNNLVDAASSPFAVKVFYPVEAENIEEARKKLKEGGRVFHEKT